MVRRHMSPSYVEALGAALEDGATFSGPHRIKGKAPPTISPQIQRFCMGQPAARPPFHRFE